MLWGRSMTTTEAPTPRFGFRYVGYAAWDCIADAPCTPLTVTNGRGNAERIWAERAGKDLLKCVGIREVRLIAVNTDEPLAVCTVERFNELLAAEQELRALRKPDDLRAG